MLKVVHQPLLPTFPREIRSGAEGEPAASLTGKARGFVETPPPIVRALTQCAVLSPRTRVLDVGLGDGRFLLEAAKRLKELGATEEAIASQLFGAEIDPELYDMARQQLRGLLGRAPEHLYAGNFLHTPPWTVGAVVGNPPYVRRHHLESLDLWLQAVPGKQPRLTDLSALFIYRATLHLEPGGRLAVIISGAWLDQVYGQAFKRFLVAHYDEIAVVGFQQRVFPEALVKPVLLLAKRSIGVSAVHRPIRLLSLPSAGEDLGVELRRSLQASCLNQVTATDFASESGLSGRLYAWEGLGLLRRQSLGECRLGDLAAIRIGFQSFAKEFFLLTADKARQSEIPPKHLRPIVLSPRYLSDALELRQEQVTGRVFWADGRPDIDPTALAYIAEGETQEVPIRGKDLSVRGFHQAPRVKRAGRNPWFNVVTELGRRGGRPILIPRRTYLRFQVVHNRGLVPATEQFLEVHPLHSAGLWPLLAYLNSTFGELSTRLSAHQYGGGVFNLNPGQARQILMPGWNKLSSAAEILRTAWAQAVQLRDGEAREVLDRAVLAGLHLEPVLLDQASSVLATLRQSAVELNKATQMNGSS